jgi:flagellar hook-basal body complex protein FliE
MNAGRIGEIQPQQLPSPPNAPAPRAGDGPSFGEALQSALRDVDAQLQASEQGAAAWTAGDGGDLHNVLLDMERADLSLRTIVQVRNKLLEAYQEIMRIQV